MSNKMNEGFIENWAALSSQDKEYTYQYICNQIRNALFHPLTESIIVSSETIDDSIKIRSGKGTVLDFFSKNETTITLDINGGSKKKEKFDTRKVAIYLDSEEKEVEIKNINNGLSDSEIRFLIVPKATEYESGDSVLFKGENNRWTVISSKHKGNYGLVKVVRA